MTVKLPGLILFALCMCVIKLFVQLQIISKINNDYI